MKAQRGLALLWIIAVGFLSCSGHERGASRVGRLTAAAVATPPAALVTSALQVTQPVGKVEGFSEVTPDGAFTYRIPLKVPDGRVGMQPELSLSYHSRAGNGALGVGWSLSGLSKITRCRKTKAADGYADRVQFDQTDSFCLDGKRLIPHGSIEGCQEWRTEIADYSKILSCNHNPEPAFFTVARKDGRVYSYGVDDTRYSKGRIAVLDSSGGSRSATAWWAVDVIRDRSGNRIELKYRPFSDLASATPLIDRIEYTTNDQQSPYAGPMRQVRFSYDLVRPDPSVGWLAGGSMLITERLTRVEMWAPNPTAVSPVWSYNIGYTHSPETLRSLLSGVKWCDRFNICLPEREFQYAHEDWTKHSEYVVKSSFTMRGPTDNGVRPILADLNGDGLDDLLYTFLGQEPFPVHQEHNPNVAVHLSQGNGFGPEIIVSGAFSRTFGTGFPRAFDAFGTQAADVDGDGDSELFVLGSHGTTAEASGYRVYDWDDAAPNKLVPRGNVFRQIAQTPEGFVLADGDGDGRIDFFHTKRHTGSSKWWHATNIGNSQFDGVFESSMSWCGSADVYAITAALDTDGDGRSELFQWCPHFAGNAAKSFGFGTTGNVEMSDLTVDVNPPMPPTPLFADVNGDGLKDMVHVARTLDVHINTGTRFLPPYLGYSGPNLTNATDSVYHTPDQIRDGIRVADFNRDGRDDLMILDRGDSLFNTGYISTAQPIVILYSDGRSFTRRNLTKSVTPGRRVRHNGNGGSVPPAGWSGTQLGDVDGDGLPEIVQVADVDGIRKIQLLTRTPSAGTANFRDNNQDRLTKIFRTNTSPGTLTSPEETIYYSQLPDDPSDVRDYAPHTRGTGCSYPQQCILRGVDVVAQHVHSHPGLSVPELNRSIKYRYENGRVDLKGRGFLGFGVVRTEEAPRGTVNITYFDNASRHDKPSGTGYVYPFAGVPDLSLTVSGLNDGTARVRWHGIDNDYRVRWLSAQAGGFTVEKMQERSQFLEGPWTAETLQLETLSFFDYDDFGNQKHARRQRSGGTETIVNTTYENRQDTWLLGLPQRIEHQETTDDVMRTRVVTLVHDAKGRLTNTTVQPGDPNTDVTLATTYTVDNWGLVTNVSSTGAHSQPRTLKIDYDQEGVYPLRWENTLGHVSWTRFHPAIGQLVATLDANNVLYRASFDHLGRIRTENPANGATVTYNYTGAPAPRASNMIVTRSVAGGIDTSTETDFLGRPVILGQRSYDGASIQESKIEYDALGRMIASTSPAAAGTTGPRTTYTYDNLDRILTITNPDATVGRHGYPNFFRTDSWDEENKQSYVVVNKDGLLETSANILGGHDIITSYRYWPFGDVKSVRDPGESTISFEYDILGRQKVVRHPDSGVREFWYSGFGEVREERDALYVTSSTYDRLGRLTGRHPAGPDAFSSTFVWDTGQNGVGKLHQAHGDETTTTYSYNTLGQLTETFVSIDGHQYRVNNTYDEYGRLWKLEYPNKGVRQPRFTLEHKYQNGYPSKVLEVGATTPFWEALERGPAGEVRRERLGNGAVTVRTYDNVTRRLTNIQTTIQRSSGPETLQSLGYYYWPNGMVSTLIDSVAGTGENFGYDSMNRLTVWHSVGTRTGLRTYQYRDDGSFTRVQDLAAFTGQPPVDNGYLYAAAGPHAATAAGNNQYLYDALGRLYERRINDVPQMTMTYTPFDLPLSVTSGGTTTRFGYDGFNRRVFKRNPADPNQITRYVEGLYEDRVPEDVFFVHAEGRTIAQVFFNRTTGQEQVSYVHDDQLGSSSTITNQIGTIVQRRYFEPFGGRIAAPPGVVAGPSGPGVPPLTRDFTGHESDDEFGLINMQGRMYDPTLRRFLTTDPIVAEPAFGQSYNPYSYVNNNPVNRLDPTGFAGSDASIRDAFSWERPAQNASGASWNIASSTISEGTGEGQWVTWSYENSEPQHEWNDVPFKTGAADSHPAGGFYPPSVTPLTGGNMSPAWEETSLDFEGRSTDASEPDLYALPSVSRDTSEFLACGPCVFVPPIIIWLSISGDTDVPGTGSPEMFAIGTVLLGGGGLAATVSGRGSSMAWPAVRARLGTELGLPSGTPVHHWLIPKGGTGQLSVGGVLGLQWGRAIPDVITNGRWNLMVPPAAFQQQPWANIWHMGLHGQGPAALSMADRLWYGSPTWAKVVVGGVPFSFGAATYYIEGPP